MARQGLFANTMGTEAAQRRAELAKERQAYLEGNIYSDPLVNIAAQSQRGMRQAFRDIGQGAATSMLGDQAYQDPILKQAIKRDKDRSEMNKLFENAAQDGVITEAEYDSIIAELSGRGYVNEAGEVMKRKQNEYGSKFQQSEAAARKEEADTQRTWKALQSEKDRIAREIIETRRITASATSDDKKIAARDKLAELDRQQKAVLQQERIIAQSELQKQRDEAAGERGITNIQGQAAIQAQRDEAAMERTMKTIEGKRPRPVTVPSRNEYKVFGSVYSSNKQVRDALDSVFGRRWLSISKGEQNEVYTEAKRLMDSGEKSLENALIRAGANVKKAKAMRGVK